MRFTPEEVKKRPKFTYLPFGGGPRLCIGNNFAMMEMQIVIAMMLQNFTPELAPNQNVATEPLITLRPANGIYLNMKARSKDATARSLPTPFINPVSK
jgi:cytochrome P450